MTYPMFDPLIDAVMVIGPNREVYYCNDACVSLFETPKKRIVSGRPCYEFVTFSDTDLFLMPKGLKGRKEKTSYRETNFTTFAGKEGVVQVALLPTQEMFGRTKLWFVYFHDVTVEANLHRKYRNQLEETTRLIEVGTSLVQTIKHSTAATNDLKPLIEAFEECASRVQTSSKNLQNT